MSIAIDRSIAKALWVDRTAFKKLNLKEYLKKLAPAYRLSSQ